MPRLCTNRLAALMTPHFLLGAATAAYQVEGSVRRDGRTHSIWDTFCRKPGAIRNWDDGETACDHYARWRDDVALMDALNLESYRFSVSWSRIIPDGSGAIDSKGIDHAPGISDEEAVGRVVHHLLLAHGLGARTLRQYAPNAKTGIALNGGPSHPASGTAADRHAALMAEAEQIEWFMEPLFAGAYGPLFRERMAPLVEDGDLEAIAEPCDYLGWNYYTRNVVRKNGNGGYALTTARGSPATALGWEIYPQGLRELLTRLADKYELPPLYITENGAVFEDRCEAGVVDDPERLDYIRVHLETIADLIVDGFDIRGYTCWSLIDNFEWAEGYSARFGLVSVDYDTQLRTIKSSGYAFAEFLEAKQRALETGQRRSIHAR